MEQLSRHFDSKFSQIFEHLTTSYLTNINLRVTSICLLKTTALTNTGAYRCSAVAERSDDEEEDGEDSSERESSGVKQSATTSAETMVRASSHSRPCFTVLLLISLVNVIRRAL